MRVYTIAFSLRSGSNVLCDYLSSCGLGQPTEYFQWPYFERHRYLFDEENIPPDDSGRYLKTLLEKRSRNGIFGSKITWDQKNYLLAEAEKAIGRIQSLEDLFPGNVWIYLQRNDKIAQAVSLWRASKSGIWSSSDQEPGRNSLPEYDYFRLLQCFFTLLIEDYLWSAFFAGRRDVIRLSFDDIRHSPRAAVQAIADRVAPGLAISPESIRSPRCKLRDSYSDEVIERFTNDLNHIGVADYWRDRRVENQRWEDFFYKELWKEPLKGE